VVSSSEEAYAAADKFPNYKDATPKSVVMFRVHVDETAYEHKLECEL
jgi:hypothetical protein